MNFFLFLAGYLERTQSESRVISRSPRLPIRRGPPCYSMPSGDPTMNFDQLPTTNEEEEERQHPLPNASSSDQSSHVVQSQQTRSFASDHQLTTLDTPTTLPVQLQATDTPNTSREGLLCRSSAFSGQQEQHSPAISGHSPAILIAQGHSPAISSPQGHSPAISSTQGHSPSPQGHISSPPLSQGDCPGTNYRPVVHNPSLKLARVGDMQQQQARSSSLPRRLCEEMEGREGEGNSSSCVSMAAASAASSELLFQADPEEVGGGGSDGESKRKASHLQLQQGETHFSEGQYTVLLSNG